MFVQATKSTRRDGKTYVSYLVRESFRTPKGPRSRTVCNITDLPAPTRDLIAASLKGQEILPAEPTNCFVNMAVWVQRVRHEPVLHLDVNQLHHMHDPIVAAWNRLQRKSL